MSPEVMRRISGGSQAGSAHLFQRPAERIGTSLVLRGKQGTGKTKVGEVFGSLIDRHYLLVDSPRYITGQFNAHLAGCILLQADEGFFAGDRASAGVLKSLVTSSWHMIERKGVDPVQVRNLVRLLVTSEDNWVVPASLEERRFAIFDMGQAAMQNSDYFAAIDREYGCRRAPGAPGLAAPVRPGRASMCARSLRPTRSSSRRSRACGRLNRGGGLACSTARCCLRKTSGRSARLESRPSITPI